MKKLILAFFLLAFTFNESYANSPSEATNYSLIKLFKKIDITYQTSNGYTIHIVWNLTHNWSFTNWTFSGNVTITGNGTNISFPVSTNMGLRISGDGKEATEVEWSTEDNKANDILNSEESEKLFLEYINLNS